MSWKFSSHLGEFHLNINPIPSYANDRMDVCNWMGWYGRAHFWVNASHRAAWADRQPCAHSLQHNTWMNSVYALHVWRNAIATHSYWYSQSKSMRCIWTILHWRYQQLPLFCMDRSSRMLYEYNKAYTKAAHQFPASTAHSHCMHIMMVSG